MQNHHASSSVFHVSYTLRYLKLSDSSSLFKSFPLCSEVISVLLFRLWPGSMRNFSMCIPSKSLSTQVTRLSHHPISISQKHASFSHANFVSDNLPLSNLVRNVVVNSECAKIRAGQKGPIFVSCVCIIHVPIFISSYVKIPHAKFGFVCLFFVSECAKI